MPTVLHVDGLSAEPVSGLIVIEPGTSLWEELVQRFGGTAQVEHRPDPVYPFPVEDYKVALEVNTLLGECESWDDLPPIRHFLDECNICAAIAVAEDLLPE